MFLALCLTPASRGTQLGQSQPRLVLKRTTGACISTAHGLHPSAAPLDKSTGNRRFLFPSRPYLDQESPFVKKPQRFSPNNNNNKMSWASMAKEEESLRFNPKPGSCLVWLLLLLQKLNFCS